MHEIDNTYIAVTERNWHDTFRKEKETKRKKESNKSEKVKRIECCMVLQLKWTPSGLQMQEINS